MKRFTTDNPHGNLSNMRNLFYIKDRETWVRGGGGEPDHQDISLNDFMRNTIKSNNLDYQLSCDNDELMDQLYERLTDGPETMEGVIALLNATAWAFSELREKLKAYEDTGITPEEVLTLRAQREQPNEPLTLEELRRMDGEPVWVCIGSGENGWCIIALDGNGIFLHGPDFESFFEPDPDFYGLKHNDPDGYFGLHILGWLAYRRKPEQEV